MSIPVVMPQLGLTMEEGTVTGWLKKTGDSVKKDEILFTLSTDKAEMEVESPVDGILGQILVQAGELVPVGTILANIEGVGERITTVGREQPSVKLHQQEAPQHIEPVLGESEIQAFDPSQRHRSLSPRAKRLAKELGVDIGSLGSSNRTGPISEEDVRAAAARRQPSSTSTSSVGHRQLIAERLTRSIQTIPTFSLSVEANAEKLLASYESRKESILSAVGVKLTLTDLLMKVFAVALRTTPELNAVWLENSVRNMTSVDVGLAVDTPKGVVAPVLRNAGTLDLQSLVARRSELVDKARRGQLSLAEIEGGVATLTNLGMYRIDQFRAIISPGQSSILAVGQIRKRPWVDETLVVRPTVLLNLTVDHRVADGAAAAVFFGKIVEMIENADRVFEFAPAPQDGARFDRSHS